MNVSVMGVLSWEGVKKDDKYLVSSFMETIYGLNGGVTVTVLILFIAMASLFAVVLGYSRVPYAAAEDGNFFKVFARLHPTKEFPYVSLGVLCGIGLLFSLIFRSIGEVVRAILAMRILVQFIGQAVGIGLLRLRFGDKDLPFRMWLFPVPIILSVAVWIFLFVSTGMFAIYGSLIAIAGVAVYFIKEASPAREEI
jgi:amino acid transporter